MYVGKINVVKKEFTRPGGMPFPHTEIVDGKMWWKWSRLWESCLDINLTLEQESFVGAVYGDISCDEVKKVEVYLDGVLCHTRPAGEIIPDTVYNVNASGSELIIRIYTAAQSVTVGDDITVLGMYDDERPLIWPEPKSLEASGEYVQIASVISAFDNDDEKFACQFLCDRLDEISPEIIDENGVAVTFIKTDSAEYAGERYTVDVSEDGVVITAGSRLALLYGADTLVQSYCQHGFAVMTVDDSPSYPFRGFHIGLPHKSQFEFTRRLINYVLIPMRYNCIILEFAGGMRFDRHPEIADAWLESYEKFKAGEQPMLPHSGMVAENTVLEKDDVRELVSWFKDAGIAVIPEVQSFGHVQYLTYAHPEVAEKIEVDYEVKDTRFEDARPEQFYSHCYCPSNSKSYELIFDIIDEIIEVTDPEYVHIGHDEIYHIGLCKKCSKKKIDDIFCEDVKKLYDYITEKGKRVMMWSDHLHPGRTSHTRLTAPAADRIPKDIIMLDFTWYFHLEDDIETDLLDKGFKVAIGNLYSSHFPRYSTRIARDGMIGGQTSMWCTTNEDKIASLGKFFDIPLVGLMLWNAEAYDERLFPCYSQIISGVVQPTMRGLIRMKPQPFGWYDACFGVEGEPAPAAVTAVCDGVVVHDSEFEIGLKCKTIVFNHATVYPQPRRDWGPFEIVGSYTVNYDDGTSVEAPLRYGVEVMHYNRPYGEPFPQAVYRHTGYVGTWFADPVIQEKAPDGSDITICGYVWDNPYPQKTVKSIAYKDAENSFAGLILESINVEEAENE